MINLLVSLFISMGVMSHGPDGLNWQVGDNADYSIKVSFLQGTMNVKVREKQGNDFWIEQNVDLMIQKSKIETWEGNKD